MHLYSVHPEQTQLACVIVYRQPRAVRTMYAVGDAVCTMHICQLLPNVHCPVYIQSKHIPPPARLMYYVNTQGDVAFRTRSLSPFLHRTVSQMPLSSCCARSTRERVRGRQNRSTKAGLRGEYACSYTYLICLLWRQNQGYVGMGWATCSLYR